VPLNKLWCEDEVLRNSDANRKKKKEKKRDEEQGLRPRYKPIVITK